MKQRRSLTHVGGAVRTAGDERIATKLAEALDVAPAPEPKRDGRDGRADDDPDRAHVHGFHTYPARMHPTTASRLVRAATTPGALVLDPFCGSGTVLVEAMIAGRRASGTDLNPLAERLARLKTARFAPGDRDALVAGARAVAAVADERRARRAGATKRYPPEDVELLRPPRLARARPSIRSAIAGLDDRLRASARARRAGARPQRDPREVEPTSLRHVGGRGP